MSYFRSLFSYNPDWFSKTYLTFKRFSYRKLKDINVTDFRSDLISSLELLPVSNDFNDLVREFCSALANTLDLHAPMISKEIVARPKVPWFTNDLRNLKRRRRRLERSLRKYGLENTPLFSSPLGLHTILALFLIALVIHENYSKSSNHYVKEAAETTFLSMLILSV